MKWKINFDHCFRCEGTHAYWWFTSKVDAPSCLERQKRKGKA